MIETITTNYVAVRIISFHSLPGKESARTSEIPPFSPPQIMIGITPSEKLRKRVREDDARDNLANLDRYAEPGIEPVRYKRAVRGKQRDNENSDLRG